MTGTIPKALRDRPSLRSDCQDFLRGFYSMNAARSMDEGRPQAIPISEILSYCRLSAIPPGESAIKLLRLVQRLDETWLNWWHKKNNAQGN